MGDIVPIEEDPNKPTEPESKESPPSPINSSSDSETDANNPVVEVQLGHYVSAPSGYQTLFHGCELPIDRLTDEINDSDKEEDNEGDDNVADEPRICPGSNTVPEDEVSDDKKENPSSLETES